MIAKGLSILACLALLGAADARAQEYPRRPISVVVPFAAGGPTDAVARLLGVAMGKSLKTQIIVENVGGAGGTIGAGRVAKAPPDGYTILLYHIGQAAAPALYRKLPYDAVGDFEPVGLVNEVPMTLVGKKDLPRAPCTS
jgi:putative tricarboxylic transport membrane protein